jgi:hypothetical protein
MLVMRGSIGCHQLDIGIPRALSMTVVAALVVATWASPHAVAQEPDARLPVPATGAVDAARDLVRQAYDEKFKAATRGGLEDLVTVLVAAAEKSDVPERKFAMLAEAQDAAANAGELGRAAELIEARAKVFRIDAVAETIATLERVLDATRRSNPVLLRGVVEQSMIMATGALKAGRLEDALTAVKITAEAAKAVDIAAKSKKTPLKDRQLIDQAADAAGKAEELTRVIRRRIKARDEMTAAAKTLETSPEDPAANGIVGSYECFVVGDWDHGLAKLARSDAGALKDVAADEVGMRAAQAPPAKDLFALAGRWWSLAGSDRLDADTATAIKAHAAQLYATSAPGLSDPLDVEIAKKRSAGAAAAGDQPAAEAAAKSDRDKNAYPERSDPALRAELVKTGGGNAASEAAVDAALKWLAAHQMPDGGWSFDMRACPACNGQCDDSGSKGADRCAATALALLPFLGRGFTHKVGPYKQELERGIGFLAALAVRGNGRAYDDSGSLYSQGVAGMALGEAYGMTRDPRLKAPTQLALNFIMEAQDPRGGGWRYTPRQPGDTSASGWNLVALRIGADAKLPVNPAVVANMGRFLDSVQADGGASYGYTDSGSGAGTTAVGLLCRLHMGWKPDHPSIQRGAAAIAERGPSTDVYRTFYANQVMYRVGGDAWLAWNAALRDALVQGQDKAGHAAGSWYDTLTSGHGATVGGRLYCTSLATLILENYYRNPPQR